MYRESRKYPKTFQKGLLHQSSCVFLFRSHVISKSTLDDLNTTGG